VLHSDSYYVSAVDICRKAAELVHTADEVPSDIYGPLA
jgi:hypothetical protein